MAKHKADASGAPDGDWRNNAMTPARAPARGRAKCGAKTRSGAPCQAPAVKGRKRCRQHGGTLPGAPATNQRAKKHGIYGTYLTNAERASLDDIRAQTGKLDAEIELVRVRIQRTLAAEERAAANEHDGLELQKYHDREASEFTAGDEHVYERVDYNAHIDRLTRRLESLERTRAELLEAQAKRDSERDDFEPVSELRITIVGKDGSFARPDGTSGNVKDGDDPLAD